MSRPSRLSLALGSGDLQLPDKGTTAVFAPRIDMDLSPLPKDRCQIITGFKPDHDHFSDLGYDCAISAEGRFCASVVCISRAKALSHMLLADAAARTDGPVIVDGTKTDGIEPLLKACRKRTDVGPVLSKAHGKLFSFSGGPGFEDWAQTEPQIIEGGFITAPGVFSADGIDPASRLLADHLPGKIGERVADLGAGWGYLSAKLLERPSVRSVHLIEADHAALNCARHNLKDTRAEFYWEDISRWQPNSDFDSIITNPPFHAGRRPNPDIGRTFIQAAARVLSPKGQLFLVANRHLPYESDMQQRFAEVSEFAGDNRFKLLRAARPIKKQG